MKLSGAIIKNYYLAPIDLPTVISASFATLTTLKSITINNITLSNAKTYNILRNDVLIASKLSATTYTDTPPGDNTQYTYTIIPYYNDTVGPAFKPTGGSGNGAIYTLANPNSLSITRNDANGSATTIQFSWTRNANNYASLVINNPSGTTVSTPTYASTTTFYNSSGQGNLSVNTTYLYSIYVLNGDGVGNNLSTCKTQINTCTWGTANAPTFTNTRDSFTTLNCTGTFNYVIINFSPNSGSPGTGSSIGSINSAIQTYTSLFPSTLYTFNVYPVNQFNYYGTNYVSSTVTTAAAAIITGTYTLTNVGQYSLATFTGNGTFKPLKSFSTIILLVGGGGAGGGRTSGYYEPGGGGGAGAVGEGNVTLASGVTYSITVGAGGVAANAAYGIGGNTSIVGTGLSCIAYGGGSGGYQGVNGQNGGCGGGAGGQGTTNAHVGGTASKGTGPGFTFYGNSGGNTTSSSSSSSVAYLGMSGGGGGAGTAGSTTTYSYSGAPGGNGVLWSINGGAYAAGGGGGASSYGGGSGSGNSTGGEGGANNGGLGGYHTNYVAIRGANASPNTGSGGGGGTGGYYPANSSNTQDVIGGNGGSGICHIAFLPPPQITPAICFNFENNLSDSGTIGVSAAITGSNITYTTDCVRGSYAIAFSGNNKSVSTANNASKSYFSFTTSISFPYTICVWLKITSAPLGNNSWIDMVTPTNCMFTCYNTSGHSMGTYTSGVKFFLTGTTSAASYNVWTHYAYVINSTTSATTYINGQVVQTGSVAPAFSSTSPQSIKFEIGWAAYQATIYGNPGFDGYMDQFLVYNVALTAQNISDIYNYNYTAF